ncbi:hypothetical protein LCGC14_0709380 [marine sediment metagenome]|uniref:Uncharacterized protein n=1 Tax=marine sediment metagenome TaxID=412755 RepID=A0A0F9T1B3_9ZZZZ
MTDSRAYRFGLGARLDAKWIVRTGAKPWVLRQVAGWSLEGNWDKMRTVAAPCWSVCNYVQTNWER